jgi:hypothetical protein
MALLLRLQKTLISLSGMVFVLFGLFPKLCFFLYIRYCMKACVLSIFLLFCIAAYSQNNINRYKYVIVPIKFDFSKVTNQYAINTTTKQLLLQKGFVAFLDNEELPPAIATNNCSALKAEVTENKSFFVTRLTLQLVDCQGNIIFQSKEGKSREKDFAVAYDAALKDAFSSLNGLAYKYDSTIATQQQQVAATPVVSSPAPVASSPAPAVSSPVPVSPAAPVTAVNTGILYAQVTANGYQLVDVTPKKILTLLKTSVQDYFIAQAETSSGIVFKRTGEWFFEYYKDDKLVSRKLEIKF